MILEGLIPLPIWGYVLLGLALTQTTIAAVTLYLHRCQTHRCLKLHPVVSHFFRFWLWLTTGMMTREWVAVHRKHHAHCETAEDPHSPRKRGIFQVLFAGAYLYQKAAKNRETIRIYGQGTPDDWIERNLYSRFTLMGVTCMGLADVLLFGVAGLVVFAVQLLWIPLWAAGVINGLGHFSGYRNFETGDASRNLIPTGWWIGGEELHNNHHAYPQSAKFSAKRWEFDIGWLYIRLLRKVRLASVVRLPRLLEQSGDSTSVGLETLRAVLQNRYHVLKLYGQQVVRPVWQTERRLAAPETRRVLRRVRKPLIREGMPLSAKAHAALEEAFARSERLRTVYRLKQDLKSLWAGSVADRSDDQSRTRLQRLQAWCVEAEHSGIHALAEFAHKLQGARLQQI